MAIVSFNRQASKDEMAREIDRCHAIIEKYEAEASRSPVSQTAMAWAVERWRAEVANRPLVNVHRRGLDTAWRQVIRHFGGDDEALCGPRHDDLVAANPELFRAPVSQKEAVAVDTEWLARASVSIADMVDDWYRSLTVKGTASIPPDLVMRRLERFAPAPAGEPGISERLYDADEPMADGEIRMTAAENVLGWLLIEKIGVPDDRNYSPNEAQEILVRRLDYANEMENERIRSALHPTPTPVSAPVGVVEALEPFVRHYEAWMDRHSDDTLSSSYSPHTFGQLRRARAVLAALRSPAVGEVSPNA